MNEKSVYIMNCEKEISILVSELTAKDEYIAENDELLRMSLCDYESLAANSLWRATPHSYISESDRRHVSIPFAGYDAFEIGAKEEREENKGFDDHNNRMELALLKEAVKICNEEIDATELRPAGDALEKQNNEFCGGIEEGNYKRNVNECYYD